MKLIVFIVVCCFIFEYSTCSKEDTAIEDKIKNLDLPALFNVSLESELDRQKASILYKWKYSNFPVEISSVSKDNNEILISNDVIYVDPGLVENFLKSFGKLIKRLSIAYHMIKPMSQHNEIGKYVNEYCAETLIEFSAKDTKAGVFDNMTKPFTKVERVAFEGSWEKTDSNKLGLDELFPELRVLNLSYPKASILECVFPKLVELNSDVEPSPAFHKFFENNKQIKKLRLTTTSMELLHVVNENLPNLDVFDFYIPSDSPSYNDPEVEFKQVKEISIKDNGHYIRTGNILFKQLKKLELSNFGRLDNVTADFIGSNENLETLIITFGNLNNSTLLTLALKLKNLVEVDIRCDLDIPIENIVEFIENNPKLKKITLNFPGNIVFLLDDLIGNLANDWIVAPVNKNFTGIEIRKQDATENTSAGSSASYIFTSTILTLTMLTMTVRGITM